MSNLKSVAARLWARVYGFLMAQNDRQVMAWGSALQYKRRYTNPDDAKRARRLQ
jgi:hypothetical protein